jgi:PAS domain S-box-containing protein
MSEQKENNEYLNMGKDTVSSLTDHLPVGIYRTTPEGEIIYANLALAKMLEYSIEEIKNITVNDLYAENEGRTSSIKNLFNHSESSLEQEIGLKTKTGKTIFVQDTVKIVKDKSGNILYFDGILVDITERKKAREALKESEARYKVLTDITIEGIIIHKDGIIIDVNPSAQRISGYKSDFVIGKNILDFIHPDYLEHAKLLFNSRFPGILEISIIRADKTKLDVELEAKNVIINGKENRVIAFRDITKRKKAEAEFLTLSTAVKQSPASIVITGTNGLIEYVNPKFTEVTGYTYEEAIGKNPSILKTEHTKSEDYTEMWEIITKGNTWTGEFLNKRKDGSQYWELASISPIIDEKGNTIKYIAVKEDITKRKKTEDALKKSEKELLQANATKNVFFSIIAHDLKGPVGNFTQLLSLLKENFNEISNEEKLDYLNLLSGLSIKTNTLLNDLLLWARIQMNTLEFTIESKNLKTLMNSSKEIVEVKANEKNIKIITNIDNINAEINESSIKTIIRNLLSNAIKFSNRNSQIEINSKLLNNNFIEISVKDSGVGIPKESIGNLFKIETSFTTYGTEKEKGSGLGLIICKELIDKNGGTIRVDSIENKGTTFYFTLPLKK